MDPHWKPLIDALRDTRSLLARPGNDFTWSSWISEADALRELDSLITQLENGTMPAWLDLEILFAPTGPVQEVGLSSDWGDEFLKVAAKFEAAVAKL